MKLGRRNCERRRQSAWRGGCHQPAVSFLFLSLSLTVQRFWPPSLLLPLLQSCRCVINPYLLPRPNPLKLGLSFPPFFNPSWAVLSHLFHLPFSFPLHSFCLSLLSSQRVTLGWTLTPIWHLFSPSHSLVCGCRRQPCHCLSINCHRCQSLLSYLLMLHATRFYLLKEKVFFSVFYFCIFPECSQMIFFVPPTGRLCWRRWAWPSVRMEARWESSLLRRYSVYHK